MLTYEQRTGRMLHNGDVLGVGYSGFADAKNLPDAESQRGFGPIPRGMWNLVEMIPVTDTHGPYVIRLEPQNDTDTFGRSGFLIHGDSILHPGAGSHGCIIMPRAVREAIWNTEERMMEVVEGARDATDIA